MTILILPGNEPDDEDPMIRLTFVIYGEDTLFKSQNVKIFNDDQDEVERRVNTRIISCTVGNQIISNLPDPIAMAFKALRVRNSLPLGLKKKGPFCD